MNNNNDLLSEGTVAEGCIRDIINRLGCMDIINRLKLYNCQSIWRATAPSFITSRSGYTQLTITHPYIRLVDIGHSRKYHNTLCLSPQILHKHCFQFL